jgi:endonuclease/exonuclease/phosphatase family metal-dependent hydrolase
MKDFMGREITAGCTIVYPVRRASSMWLSRMEVQQVTAKSISGYNPEGRRVTVHKFDTVVVVEPLKPAAPATI